LKAVVYDFCESRAGEHARTFLGEWKDSLVCDDYADYKAGFVNGITEAGCMAHSRRKFFDLHVISKSQIAGQACAYIGQLYDVEREEKHLNAAERLQVRKKESRPLADAFHQWMLLQRQKITDGSATAKALDYRLKRWGALTQFLEDGRLPIDNNWIENQIRPIAIGRNNWVFAGSLRAGQRTAAVMSLIQSAKLNGHDPYAYLKDVLARLPTHMKARSKNCCHIAGSLQNPNGNFLPSRQPRRQHVLPGRLPPPSRNRSMAEHLQYAHARRTKKTPNRLVGRFQL
jgi:transposase